MLPCCYHFIVRWPPGVPTDQVATVTAPPTAGGWQTTYWIGLQADRPVVMGLAIHALVGAPRGGLTAETARSLIRTGEALREFARALVDRRAMPEATDSEIQALVAGHAGWRTGWTPEFRAYLRYLESLPAITRVAHGRRPSRRGRPLTREERLAETAVLYAAAVAARHPAPRKRVAQLLRRPESVVRDDLHRARTANPQLLTSEGHGRAGGTPTDRARAIWSELRGDGTRTRRASKRPTDMTKGEGDGKTRQR